MPVNKIVIFVYPIIKQLQMLKTSLESESSIEIVETDSVEEVGSTVEKFKSSLVLLSDAKKCAKLISIKKDFFLRNKDSKLLLITKNLLPESIVSKLMNFGLSDILQGDISEKSVKHKVTLLLKTMEHSEKISSAGDSDQFVVKSKDSSESKIDTLQKTKVERLVATAPIKSEKTDDVKEKKANENLSNSDTRSVIGDHGTHLEIDSTNNQKNKISKLEIISETDKNRASPNQGLTIAQSDSNNKGDESYKEDSIKTVLSSKSITESEHVSPTERINSKLEITESEDVKKKKIDLPIDSNELAQSQKTKLDISNSIEKEKSKLELESNTSSKVTASTDVDEVILIKSKKADLEITERPLTKKSSLEVIDSISNKKSELKIEESSNQSESVEVEPEEAPFKITLMSTESVDELPTDNLPLTQSQEETIKSNSTKDETHIIHQAYTPEIAGIDMAIRSLNSYLLGDRIKVLSEVRTYLDFNFEAVTKFYINIDNKYKEVASDFPSEIGSDKIEAWSKIIVPEWSDETFQSPSQIFVYPIFEGELLLGIVESSIHKRIKNEMDASNIEAIISLCKGFFISEMHRLGIIGNYRNLTIWQKIKKFFKKLFKL